MYRMHFGLTGHPLPKGAQGKTFYDKGLGYTLAAQVVAGTIHRRVQCAHVQQAVYTGFTAGADNLACEINVSSSETRIAAPAMQHAYQINHGVAAAYQLRECGGIMHIGMETQEHPRFLVGLSLPL